MFENYSLSQGLFKRVVCRVGLGDVEGSFIVAV